MNTKPWRQTEIYIIAYLDTITPYASGKAMIQRFQQSDSISAIWPDNSMLKWTWKPSVIYMCVYIYIYICRDIFCLKNFDPFTRTPVGVSKMNAVARAQLTYRMFTLLQKIVYIYISMVMYLRYVTIGWQTVNGSGLHYLHYSRSLQQRIYFPTQTIGSPVI